MSEITGIGGALASSAVQAVTKPTPAKRTTEETEGFERLLLGQLTKDLVDSAMPENEEASAATNTYRQMLPDALTEALMSAGGIGLAKQLAEATGEASS